MGYIPNEWGSKLRPASYSNGQIYWHDIWVRALKNMPTNKNGTGEPGALCRLLGYPIHRVDGGGQYSAHNRVFTNLMRGSKPRDAEKAAKLLRLARPDGKLVAWMTLCKMGYGRKYKI